MESRAVRRPSSERKRRAVLDAAEHVFVADGYDAAAVDEIAERSGVSKQTVYAHFGSKQALFVEVVVGATAAAFDALQVELPDPGGPDELAEHLERYGRRQLELVLHPRLLGLRRLAIAEVHRFPELGRAFWAGGPHRAVTALGDRIARLHAAGLLDAPDPGAAARAFNWLLAAEPLNAAMMLGEAALPGADGRRAAAAEATRVFLAAYGPAGPTGRPSSTRRR
jgi:TetR/AcrR family transcriptional regulator, mexJK operon transcriptional repressor